MIRLAKTLLLSVLLLCFCGAACAQSPWTVMVYMVGADLEEQGLATADLKEILAACAEPGAPDVWICTGGSAAGWHTPEIPADECVVWRLQNGQLQKQVSLGRASMGESGTLRDFLAAVPASERSMLILWDHGRGPLLGFGRDAAFDDDPLTLDELQNALAGFTFDVIGLDACVMSTLETAAALAPAARYAVLSQEAEPGTGWDYAFLSSLPENALEAGEAAASASMDSWREPYREWPAYEPPLSISVVDLSMVSSARTALQTFLEKLSGGLEAGGFRTQMRIMDQTCQPGRFTLATAYDTFDLLDLCAQYQPYFPAESGALAGALNALIVQNHSNVTDMRGVSLFLPRHNPGLYREYSQLLETVAACPAQTLLARQYARQLEGVSAEYQALAAPQAEKNEIIFPLTAAQLEDFSAANVLLFTASDQQTYELLGTARELRPDENGILRYVFEDRALYMENGHGDRALVPLMDIRESAGVTRGRACAVLTASGAFDENGLYRPGSIQNVLLDTAFNTEGEAMLTGLQNAEPLSSGKNALRLSDFGEILFSGGSYEAVLDENGLPLPFENWQYAPVMTLSSLSLDEDTFLYTAPYPQEIPLYAQFQIKDLYGQTHASPLIQVR